MVTRESQSPIFNLSRVSFTSAELSILAKGLSFVPTTFLDPVEIKKEVLQFLRKVRLKVFFSGALDQDTPTNIGLSNKSTFCPPSNLMPPQVLAFENIILQQVDVVANKKMYCKYNCNKEEFLALRSLSDRQDIVVKPADKGGGIVVLDTQAYDGEVLRQLNNHTHYRLLPSDPTARLAQQILELTKNALEEGWIGEKEFAFLNKKDPRMPVFYALPKVHKGLSNPPGRPIVSACGSLMEPLAKFVDIFLKPFVPLTKAFVKDTMDMINKVEGLDFASGSQLLCTLDIEALYTNISQDIALEVIFLTLEKRSGQIIVPSQFIMELASLCLKNNFFLFGDSMYLQIKGVAMGCCFAPEVANLVMDAFEQKWIFSEINPYHSQIRLWLRYIDDIFFIWKTDEDVANFLEWLNNRCEDFKFTLFSDNERINFLDLYISVQEDSLVTSLFTKPTDRNTLLHFSSCHPKTLRENLPYGQFLRIRRNCTNREDFFLNAEALVEKLICRGYPKRLVRHSLKRAWYTPRETLLVPKQKEVSFPLTCVLTYSPKAQKIKRIISRHMGLLCGLGVDKPLFSFRKGKNIRQHLVRAQRRGRQDKDESIVSRLGLPPVVGHFRCHKCVACKFTQDVKSVMINDIKIDLKRFSNCNTKNVVYCINCPCKLFYIGQTGQAVKTRILQHRSRIKCKVQGAPLVSHFTELSHSENDLEWYVIFVIDKDRRGGSIQSTLTRKEAELIEKFHTAQHGLNELDEVWALIN